MADGPEPLRLALELAPTGARLATVSRLDGVIDVRQVLEPPTPTNLSAAATVLAQRAPGPIVAVGAALPQEPLDLPPTLLGLPVASAPIGTCLLAAAGDRVGDGVLVLLRGQVQAGARVGGRLLRHLDLAHLCVDPLGPPCPCGTRGCLTSFVGSDALQAYADQLGLPPRPPVPGVDEGGQSADLSERARHGDRLVLAILAHASEQVGVALGQALRLLDLQVAALILPPEADLPELNRVFAAALARSTGGRGRLVRVPWQPDAALLGAALLPDLQVH